ncbi:bacteriocin immunity protein [Pseudomonas fluorescens]|jgi:hypothetical protein|uniref:bacteriocin immunity protein n=1 Tax=Pseudomonas fluorescens TaxID=294 RepID=UPI000F4A32F1|nr:bacteriocin immunity protein [Pseudomonas fluorescens]
MYRKFEDFTESEFLELLRDICFMRSPSDKAHMKLVEQFEKASEHPERSGVIYYPSAEDNDSPEGILETVKKWRAAHGKPGFKDQ